MSSAAKDRPSRYRWAALALALLAQTGANLVHQAIAPLSPLFQQDLGLTRTQVGLVSSASSVGVWSIALAGGLLTDRFGVRKILSMCLIAIGSVMLSTLIAGSLFHLIVIMLLAGVARGSIFPSSTKGVAEWFPPRERATAMGIKQLGMPISGILAAALLPALGLALGWRAAFSTPGLFALIAAVAFILFYYNPQVSTVGKAARLSIRRTIVELARNRMLLTLSLVGFFYLFVMLALIAYLALYFNEVALLSSVPDEPKRIVAAGGFLAVCNLGGAAGRVFWGVVSDRLFDSQRAMVLAIIGGLSALMLAILGSVGSNCPLELLIVVAFACGATGLGWNGVYGTLITDTVSRKYAATGIGLSMTLTDIATIIAPPIFGMVVDSTASYSIGWLTFSLFPIAGCFVAVALSRQEKLLKTMSTS